MSGVRHVPDLGHLHWHGGRLRIIDGNAALYSARRLQLVGPRLQRQGGAVLHDIIKVRLPGSSRMHLVAYVLRHDAHLRTNLAGLVRANPGLCADVAATPPMVTELSIMQERASRSAIARVTLRRVSVGPRASIRTGRRTSWPQWRPSIPAENAGLSNAEARTLHVIASCGGACHITECGRKRRSW